MKLTVLKESGFEEALLGLSLSFDSEPSKRVADKLAWKGGGESKFLESIVVWIDLDAPRYWWAQFDTYRVGISKQSESSIHTLMRRALDEEKDFFAKNDPAKIAFTLDTYRIVRGDDKESTDDLFRLLSKPLRREKELIDGVLYVKGDGELIRSVGKPSKSPLFLARNIKVVSTYDKINGARVKTNMELTADVLVFGTSKLTMTYKYFSVNGVLTETK